MDASAYSVLTTAHFDRLMKKLAPKLRSWWRGLEETIEILSLDPFNKSRQISNQEAARGLLRVKGSIDCARVATTAAAR